MGYGAFGTALLATLASLTLSEVFKWVPCDLCWYQRVFMYSLPFIIGIGVMRKDDNWTITALPIAVIGWLIALYHSLLQWGIIPSGMAPCTNGVDCSIKEIEPWLGFVTIPFMSLVSFTLIIAMTVIYKRGVEKGE